MSEPGPGLYISVLYYGQGIQKYLASERYFHLHPKHTTLHIVCPQIKFLPQMHLNKEVDTISATEVSHLQTHYLRRIKAR